MKYLRIFIPFLSAFLASGALASEALESPLPKAFDFFCADLFDRVGGSPAERLFEAYGKSLDSLRNEIGEEEFDRIVEKFLVQKNYFAVGELPARAPERLKVLLAQISTASKNRPGAVDAEAFEAKIRTYLEEVHAKIGRSAVEVSRVVKDAEEIRRAFRIHSDTGLAPRTEFKITSDGRWILGGSALDRSAVLMIDSETGKTATQFDLAPMYGEPVQMKNIEISRDKTRALITATKNQVTLVDLVTRKPVWTVEMKTAGAAIHTNENFTQAGYFDGAVFHRFSLETGEEVGSQKLLENPIFTHGYLFTPDWRELVTKGDAPRTKPEYIDVATGKPKGIFDSENRVYSQIERNGDSKRVVLGRSDGLDVWDLGTGKVRVLRKTLDRTASDTGLSAEGMRVSPSGDRVAFLYGEYLEVWNLKSRKRIFKLKTQVWEESPMAVMNADLTRGLIYSTNGAIEYWDLVNGKLIAGMVDEKLVFLSAEVTPDFKVAVLMTMDNRMIRVDLEEWERFQ